MASSGNIWPQWQENKLFTVLLAILMVYLIVFMYEKIMLTARAVATAGYGDQMAPTVTVSGSGDAYGSPDLRKVDLTMTATGATANAAQDVHSGKVATLLTSLKELAIEDDDMQTSNYSVYPTYDYDQSPAAITGYETSQTITVTMRDEQLVARVLQVAGDNGITYIGDVQLTIEDTSALESEARQEALAEAYEQAAAIAAAMGATLGKPVSYYESAGGGYPMYYGKEAMMDSATSSFMPSLPEGENEVSMNVTVTYAIE